MPLARLIINRMNPKIVQRGVHSFITRRTTRIIRTIRKVKSITLVTMGLAVITISEKLVVITFTNLSIRLPVSHV